MTTEQIWKRIIGGNCIIPEQYDSQLRELEADGKIKRGERTHLPLLNKRGKANPNYGIKVRLVEAADAAEA